MASAGLGGTGTLGRVDQPWPHQASGEPAATNGPDRDLPPVLAPAGGVHATMIDWAKFLIDQLRGGSGQKALLPSAIYQAMQSAQKGTEAGYDWGVCRRSWSQGTILEHEGSNGMNDCVCWLAPTEHFGVLVCCNQGGAEASQAVDVAAGALIKWWQGRRPSSR